MSQFLGSTVELDHRQSNGILCLLQRLFQRAASMVICQQAQHSAATLHTGVFMQQLSLSTATCTAQELTVLPLSMLLLHILQVGKKNRSVGATLMNQDSSRSHSIFTITVERLQQGTGEVSGRAFISANCNI